MNKPEPADIHAIARPRLGFFGVIDERMDLCLVAELARIRPDWHMVMIGPVMKIEPTTLPRLRYLAGWQNPDAASGSATYAPSIARCAHAPAVY